jgi:hypothetical protein
MKSANQLYKESKTSLPFKEWLNEQKRSGLLKEEAKNEKVMYQNATEEKNASLEFFGINVKYIAIGLLVVGAAYMGYRYWKKRQ